MEHRPAPADPDISLGSSHDNTSAEIADVLGEQVPRRTLQFRLKRLVDDGRVLREGGGRWARYSAPEAVPAPVQHEAAADEAAIPLSPESEADQ
jgi:hypothetical protein